MMGKMASDLLGAGWRSRLKREATDDGVFLSGDYVILKSRVQTFPNREDRLV